MRHPSLMAELYGSADPKLLQLLSLAALNPIRGLSLDVESYREALYAALDLLHEKSFELERTTHRLNHWKQRALDAERRGVE